METFKSVLVVSRMTPYCREAIRYGISLARKFDARLHVLHLVTNPVSDMKAVSTPGLIFSDQHRRYKDSQQESKEELDKIIKREIKDGFPIDELISGGDPVKEICRVVKEKEVDLIVMLAHQEGRLEHVLFGGEMDAIIRSLPCSILLVKSEPKPIGW